MAKHIRVIALILFAEVIAETFDVRTRSKAGLWNERTNPSLASR
jgi:hypothetical protein